jgi:hypothetical protein
MISPGCHHTISRNAALAIPSIDYTSILILMVMVGSIRDYTHHFNSAYIPSNGHHANFIWMVGDGSMLLGLHHSGNCTQRLVFTPGTGSPHLPPHQLLRWKISRKLFLVSNDFESASTLARVYILFLTVLTGEASSELEQSINWYALESGGRS